MCARQQARGSRRRELEVDDAGVGPVELVARLREVARAEQNQHVWCCAADGNVARAVSLHRGTGLFSQGRSPSVARCPCPGGGRGPRMPSAGASPLDELDDFGILAWAHKAICLAIVPRAAALRLTLRRCLLPMLNTCGAPAACGRVSVRGSLGGPRAGEWPFWR